MRINIFCFGKMKDKALLSIIHSYTKQMKWHLTIKVLSSEKNNLLDSLPASDFIIMLDETGKNISSAMHAEIIEKQAIKGVSNISYVIGPADGFSEKQINRADLLLSFGCMTWPHLFVRAMLVEQIYRAEKIISGHPYQKG